MKHRLVLFLCCAALLLAAGCKKNPSCIIPLPEFTQYAGEYLQVSDVLRIGHALDRTAPRVPVQWENGETGYQYSMMIFSSDQAGGETVSRFTVLSIEPSGEAEVLALLGRSARPGVWNIVAEKPASAVGKAARMDLAATPVPKASLKSDHFEGFVVEQ
ncbi:MAG: hypothetical protein V3571_04055 [Pseudodesulfovibrio sp.]